MVAERQRHRAREVLDRADLLEDLLEAGGVGTRAAGRPWRPRPGPSRPRCRAASRRTSVCRARRFGTSSGSRILAKEMRCGPGACGTSGGSRTGGARGGQEGSFRGLAGVRGACRTTRDQRPRGMSGGQRKAAAYPVGHAAVERGSLAAPRPSAPSMAPLGPLGSAQPTAIARGDERDIPAARVKHRDRRARAATVTCATRASARVTRRRGRSDVRAPGGRSARSDEGGTGPGAPTGGGPLVDGGLR